MPRPEEAPPTAARSSAFTEVASSSASTLLARTVRRRTATVTFSDRTLRVVAKGFDQKTQKWQEIDAFSVDE